MENKYNVLDPVLVYATIDSITTKDGELTYSLKLDTKDGYIFVDFVLEEQIQTVF